MENAANQNVFIETEPDEDADMANAANENASVKHEGNEGARTRDEDEDGEAARNAPGPPPFKASRTFRSTTTRTSFALRTT
ncbi:Uu.00g094540.m01.CDS01 [Anthostomella pinea]|uniref:Uu.00g094540.m01.CDS01 n=1 Tax=Anthostomella pinea TaxID=933095 RepID=A0AAI8YKT3_9PEZI|nr:Uu.00g094540.m01.CDS01 [Anthostomella pinea]